MEMVYVLLLILWIGGFVICVTGGPLRKDTDGMYWFSRFDEGCSGVMERAFAAAAVVCIGGVLYVALTISILGLVILAPVVIYSAGHLLGYWLDGEGSIPSTPEQLARGRDMVYHWEHFGKKNIEREMNEIKNIGKQ